MKGASSDESLNFLEEFSCKQESTTPYFVDFTICCEREGTTRHVWPSKMNICVTVYIRIYERNRSRACRPTDAPPNEKGFIPPVCNRFARLRSRFMAAPYPPTRWNFSLSKSMEGGTRSEVVVNDRFL